ncbi:ABC transporter permease [Nitratireductor sp.]|uniref:ABC transporter permease n=1 Tax=Nitratireductor sp. TaxID=1872084 RepID=UPI00261B8B64|nr:ABC transporter permease [Nitratireductor sp.]MCV0378337.1 ABC transporter permease [Nitratireductor sp.]
MKKYILKQLFQIVPVLFIITFIVFCLVYVAGDPVSMMLPLDAPPEQIASLRAKLGLDQPLMVQYFTYMGNLLQGDFGNSFRYSQPALEIVLERVPATLELAFSSMLVATVLAVPLGIWSATSRNSALDLLITGGSVLGKAMPNFWLGIMLILLLAVTFRVFPVSGRGGWQHLVLPSITMGTAIAAEMTRLIRSSMLEILEQDYVKTARSKGISSFLVVYKHAFRNALIPVITIMALQTSHLVGGALITESVFAWPGLGQLIVQAVNGRDMAILQAAIIITAFMVIAINMMADLLYRVVDPRIQ